jgi:AmiR/NasT family two-component response regulator
MLTEMLLRGVRILVAEDEPVLAFDLAGLLRQAGADVLGPVMTVAKAISVAKDGRPHCAVLDVTLRDGPIFPAALVLRELGAGIVFYTGCADLDGLKREWPEAHVLFKPAPHGLLLSTVAVACKSA